MFANRVLAKHIHQRRGVGGRFDAFGIDLADFCDVMENARQLLGINVNPLVGHRQPGQFGHVPHIVITQDRRRRLRGRHCRSL